MSHRPDGVKPTYRPIKNSELKTVADIYKGLLTATGVLALFTAKDSHVDSAWVTAFGNAITNVGNIVPSRVIIQTNKDFTRDIKLNSKKCVEYGKTLSYWLPKAFPDQPGKVSSFPVVPANDKMRQQDTEGFLDDVNTIIELVSDSANNAALVAAGWPASNLTDYEDLRTTVYNLNVQQELAKKFIPENTDEATLVRNQCYSYIQTLVTLKDMVYYSNKLKRYLWAVSTNLNQIRSGGGTTGVKFEGDVLVGEVADNQLTGITANPSGAVTIIVVGNILNFSSQSTPGNIPGPIVWSQPPGTYHKTQAEFASLIGAGAGSVFMKVQNVGPGDGHFKVVFAV